MASQEDKKARRMLQRAREIIIHSEYLVLDDFCKKNKLKLTSCNKCNTETYTVTYSKGNECVECGTLKK